MTENTSSENEIEKLLLLLRSRRNGTVWIECIAWTTIELLIFIGNTITLKIIFCNPSLRTIPNFLIASLALSDIGLGIFSGILCLGVLISSMWPFTAAACQFHGIVALTFACASVGNLTLMALNRYFRIVRTAKYRSYFSKRRTVLYIFGVWIISIIGAVSYIPSGHRFVFHPGKFFCYLNIRDYVFLALVVTLYIACPAVVIAFCYYKVYKVINNHNKSMSNWGTSSHSVGAQEINITRTLFLVVVMFMVCWLPIFIMDIIDVVHLKSSLPREAYVAYTFFAASSSSINPILYGVMNPTFRKEYLKSLGCSWRRPQGVGVIPYEHNLNVKSARTATEHNTRSK